MISITNKNDSRIFFNERSISLNYSQQKIYLIGNIKKTNRPRPVNSPIDISGTEVAFRRLFQKPCYCYIKDGWSIVMLFWHDEHQLKN